MMRSFIIPRNQRFHGLRTSGTYVVEMNSLQRRSSPRSLHAASPKPPAKTVFPLEVTPKLMQNYRLPLGGIGAHNFKPDLYPGGSVSAHGRSRRANACGSRRQL